ncbi:hemerythrin family protein [Candidatus Dependentiae bacterium]|nr:hemerythrin family protein [Candidatus Dependentiae bacterium]
MAHLVWTEELSVNEEIDNQHKKLFEIFNQLHEKITIGETSMSLDNLMELFDFTLEHFETEEKLFQKFSYPGFAEQKKEHDELTAKVMELQKKAEAGDLTISFDILNFLYDWLLNHTTKIDKKFAEFLKNKN